jgi:hypothetical protein
MISGMVIFVDPDPSNCDRCGNSGFAGYGTGYDAICDDCAGQSAYIKPHAGDWRAMFLPPIGATPHYDPGVDVDYYVHGAGLVLEFALWHYADNLKRFNWDKDSD